MRRFGCAGLGAALLLVAATTQAQVLPEGRARQGYYISLDVLQGGAVQTVADHGTLSTWPAMGMVAQVGEMLGDWASMGLRLSRGYSWGRTRQGNSLGMGFVFSALLWRQLSLDAGIGLGVAYVQPRAAKSYEESQGGVGTHYSAGCSYAFFPWHEAAESGGLALAPTLSAFVVPSEGVRTFSVLAGLRIVWWRGLGANRLAPTR